MVSFGSALGRNTLNISVVCLLTLVSLVHVIFQKLSDGDRPTPDTRPRGGGGREDGGKVGMGGSGEGRRKVVGRRLD